MAKRRMDAQIAEASDHVVALVLGGGRGSRLHPLTQERAKPAVPLCGQYRIVDIPLSNCIHSGIKRIYVLTQFNSASLHRHINNTYKFDTFSRGFVEILAAEQTVESGDWFQGTADAVRKHLREIDHLQASQFLILSGDQLYRMNYRELLETHMRAEADITVAALPVTRTAARGFGILRVDSEGRIREFVEKPQSDAELDELVTAPEVFAYCGLDAVDRPFLASMGVYMFRPNVLERILRNEPQWIDFGRDVIPNSLLRHHVHSHLFAGFWEDIGTVRSYYETSMMMLSPDPPFRFHASGQPVYTRPRYLPGALVHRATITDSVLCGGCTVRDATVSNSIIGIRTQVRPGVVIERSIIMGSDYYEDERRSTSPIPMGIGDGSVIRRAIIDKNARIGKNVVIRGFETLPDTDGLGHVVRDGIVIVLKNAIIPDGMQIGQV
jgi:glucose-1-phosphate adenylyltransferase